MPATPPRRAHQRHGAHLVQPGKENCAPAVPRDVNKDMVQTPTKKVHRREGGRCDVVRRALSMVEENTDNQRIDLEVKHTFIHFGSPVKTLTVRTPPKTVPSNFAPERGSALCASPAASPLPRGSPAAATPWTQHRAAFGGAGQVPTAAAPRTAAAQPAAGAAPSVLRLSDFLASPAAVPALPTASTAPSSMLDKVPPLPGGGCLTQPFGAAAAPFGYSAQMAQFQQLQEAGLVPPPGAPPLAAPAPTLVPPAALPPPPSVPCLGSTPLTTLLHYTDAPAALAPSLVTTAIPLTLSGPEQSILPGAMLQEQVVSLLLPPCTQPAASLGCPLPQTLSLAGSTLAAGAPLVTNTLSVSSCLSPPAAPSAPETQEGSSREPQQTKRVSICAGHFPEPGSAQPAAQQRVSLSPWPWAA